MPHPSIVEDTPRHALWEIRKIVRRYGHDLGPENEGIAVCRRCDAAMVDDDAYAWHRGLDPDALGSFLQPCPGLPQFDGGSANGSATTRATHYALAYSELDDAVGAYVCDGHAAKFRRRCEQSQNPDLTWSVNRTGFSEKLCEICAPGEQYANRRRKARRRW